LAVEDVSETTEEAQNVDAIKTSAEFYLPASCRLARIMLMTL
jgi:hypothetical protein